MKISLLRVAGLVAMLFASAFSFAEAPASYYSSLNGKKDAELKTALYNIIHNFTRISSYQDLPKYFQTTDVYPESRRWWDMYSDIPLYAPSFSGLNREHSFPNSWWGGSTDVGAYVDLNHLYPSEMKANTAKSNFPLGTVDMSSNVSFDNGICKVGYPVNGQGGGAQKVFEPDDEYKGDFARTYFYMVTCYQNLTWKYTYMVSQNLYPTLNQWSVDLLMKWHREDPVSQKEIDRNEAVFGFQNNRNPFIDRPELAEYLWGSKKGEAYTPGEIVVPPTGDPELIAPQPGMTLDFGQVALGKSYTARLLVSGKFLPAGYVSVTVYTENKDMFSSASSQIPVAQVNSEDGYWLEVTYKPTALGTHISRLLLSGDFGSVGVALRGECLPVPELSALTATAATDIESDRYVANWNAAPEEVIDYYMVTRTRYTGSQVVTEELPAEDNFLEIVGFDQSDSESYSVQSVRLGYRSPMSNVVFVDHSGVADVVVEQPLVVQAFPGFVRFICSQPQTNCRIYDISGRQIYVIDEIYQNYDLELPLGIYLITTDEHPTPVRVYIR